MRYGASDGLFEEPAVVEGTCSCTCSWTFGKMQAHCCSPYPPIEGRASGIAGAELHRCGMCMGNKKKRTCKRSTHQGRCGNFATQNCPLLHVCIPKTIGRAWLHYFAAVHRTLHWHSTENPSSQDS